MERTKLIVLGVIGILLLLFLIDRHREATPIDLLRKSVDEARLSAGKTEAEILRLRQEFERQRQTVETQDAWIRERLAALSTAMAHGVTLRSGTASDTSHALTLTTTPGANPEASQTAERDGCARLGVNFLKPYDRSDLDVSKIGGEYNEFNSTPDSFNPVVGRSAEAADVEALANDALCNAHPATPDRWSEGLATSVVISDDWKTYTFTIRKGVRWHRPPIADQPEFAWLNREVTLTAHDFVFYLDMVMNPDVEASSLRSYYEELASWVAIDDQTLRLTWKRKVFLSLNFSLELTPLPRHIYGCDRNGAPLAKERLGAVFNKHWFDELNQFCGVGGYQVNQINPDRFLLLNRNPGYWGASLHFERIRWNAEVRDPNAQLLMFKNQQTQLVGMTPNQYQAEIVDRNDKRFVAPDPANPKAGRDGALAWERCTSRTYRYIGWNLRRPLFSDKRVRYALAYAFPKERIIRDVYKGLGRPQIGPVHLDHPQFNKELVDFAFDPAKAKALLAEAGWIDSDGDGILDKEVNGKRMSFRFTFSTGKNSSEAKILAQIYANELKAIGIAMSVRELEWKDLLEALAQTDFDACMLAWRVGLEVDFHQLWHSSTADEPRSSNHCGFKNPEVDGLSDQLRLTFDNDERGVIAKKIQRIIFDEQPYLFVMCPYAVVAWNPAQLGGVTYGLDHFHPLYSREKNRWFIKAQ